MEVEDLKTCTCELDLIVYLLKNRLESQILEDLELEVTVTKHDGNHYLIVVIDLKGNIEVKADGTSYSETVEVGAIYYHSTENKLKHTLESSLRDACLNLPRNSVHFRWA